MALGRAIAGVACAGALALGLLAGCGAETHPNDPRPSVPTRVSVAVHDGSITVAPDRIGLGPDERQQVPQNKGQKQPDINTDAPLDVVFVSANLTTTESKLKIEGTKSATSGLLVANGNNTFQVGLPTGVYRVSAEGIDAPPAKLVVGPYRASSQNDLLMP
jgi:hypothetical protein